MNIFTSIDKNSMLRMLAGVLLSIFLSAGTSLQAQLTPGDIMFVGVVLDGNSPADANCGDGFAFAALSDIPANTTIFFTEGEYTASGFSASEGDVSWSHTEVVPAGTVVQVTTNHQDDPCAPFSTTVGTAQFAAGAPGQWALATGNEEIYAYLGTVRNPTTWLCAILTDNSNNANVIPAELNGFVLDFTAVDQDLDVAVLSNLVDCGNKTDCLAYITDLNNWSTEDSPGSGDCCNGSGVSYPGDLPTSLQQTVLVEGAALDFDGVDDQVSIPAQGLLSEIEGNYSISAWVNIDNNTINQTIFSAVDQPQFANERIYFSANTPFYGNVPFLTLQINGGAFYDLIGTETLTTNEWHHLAVAYDASATTLTLYVDGEENATNTNVPVSLSDLEVGEAYLGYYPVNSQVSGHFSGQMDDFRITSSASSCYEVNQQANCELTADAPGLEVYYRFNQDIANSGVTTLDATVGPDGTLQNFALMGMGSDFVEEGAVATGTMCDPVLESAPALSGLGMDIANGDDTPTADDGTDYGDVIVDESSVATFEISNTGAGTFVVDTVLSSNPAFEITTILDSVVVNTGTPITLQVAFNPTAVGSQTATITLVTDDCAVGDYTFTIQGNGVECAPVINGVNITGCNGNNITLEVDGELNGAAQWQWTITPNGDCETDGASSGPTVIFTLPPGDPIGEATFYVRAAGGCLDVPVCFPYVANDLLADLLDLSFTAPGPFTTTDGLQPLTGGMPMGGTYSGTGVVDNGDGTFSFDPSIGAGTYTITYTFVDGNGCTGLDTDEIIVEEGMLLPDNECGGANDISALFGQAPNEPQTSGLFDNTGYNSTNDPANGFECFDDGTLERTTWYTFVGDGNTYQIKTVECNATNYLTNGDTQIAIYSGDCSNPSPEACNEDEDFANDIYNGNVELQTEAGVTYLMMIDGWTGANYSAEGEFCIEVTNLTEPVELTSVTFQVDASLLVADGTLSAEGIFLAGGFNDFNGEPMNEGADNIWTLTLDIQPGTYTYKFQNGPGGWETIDTSIGEDCTVGGYADREVVVEDMDLTTDLVCFGYCTTCNVVNTEDEMLATSIEVFPNPAKEVLNVLLDLPQATNRLNIRLMNALGQVVSDQEYGQLQSGLLELDLSAIPAGAYLLQIRDGKAQFTQPVVIQK